MERMRLVLAAVAIAALALWWLNRPDGRAARQTRELQNASHAYPRTEPRSDRAEGPGEPQVSRAPDAEPRERPSRDAATDKSYIPIRCRDERGMPVAGLTIAVDQLRAGRHAARTDAGGCSTIRWEGAPGTSLRVHLFHATRHGLEARVTASTRKSANGAPLDIVVTQPVDRVVRVFDLDRRPVAKATVTIDPVIPEEGLVSALPGGWNVRTDARGECIVTVNRELPYRLTVEAAGFIPEHVWTWTAPADRQPTLFEIAYACAVEGSVTGLQPGVKVELRGASYGEATTDAAGRFRVESITPGEHDVIVFDAKGRVRALRNVVVVDDLVLDPIPAQPLLERRLEILDADRNPARNAQINFEPGNQFAQGDRAGLVALSAATVPGLWVIVGADGCGSRWIPVTKLTSPVVLPRECTVRIRVVLGKARPEFLLAEYAPPGCPRLLHLLDVGDGDGELPPITGLPPGPLEVTLLGQTRRVELHPDKPATVVFPVGK